MSVRESEAVEWYVKGKVVVIAEKDIQREKNRNS